MGMSQFAMLSFLLFLYFALTECQGRRRATSVVGLVSALLCGLTTGARAFVVSAACATAICLFAARSMRRKIALVIVATTAIVGLWTTDSQLGIIDTFVSRWRSAGDTFGDRVTGETVKVDYLGSLQTSPFGVGLGAQSALTVGQGQASQSDLIDHGTSKVVVEGGFPGICALLMTWLICGALLLGPALNHEVRFQKLCIGVIPALTVCGGVWYASNVSTFSWLLLGLSLIHHPKGARADVGLAPRRVASRAVSWTAS
jgi:hypothetical protein